MEQQTKHKGSHKPPYARIGRAGGRGVFLFCLLIQIACAPAGSGADSAAAAAPFVPGSTKQMTFQHGLGFLCWLSDNNKELWCWASEQAALDNGDAGLAGLTSLTPKLVYVAGNPAATVVVTIYDHAICHQSSNLGDYSCEGSTLSGIANVYTEAPDCATVTTDSVHCPGEANADLTFSGLTLSYLKHSPTWFHVRRSC